MTTQTYRLKISRVNSLKLKVLSKFPADVQVGNFITLTKENGVYTFSADYSKLTPGPISDPSTAFIAIEDKAAGIYREVSLASLLTSGLDADLQAIAALTGSGVLVRTADDTWTVRTITGTANEITVTNGDGVSGNPTLSLPSALTFTGKTVTGGTFNSPAINTPTGIVKGDVGLGNVDNTSDATKNAATATLTNKTISGANNTLTVREADLSTTDVTTGNVSTTKHGFAPKLPNDASKFLNGVGGYTVPPGTGGGSSSDFVTKSDALAYSPGTNPDYIRFLSQSGLAPDNGGQQWLGRKVGSAPSHDNYITIASGAIYERVPAAPATPASVTELGMIPSQGSGVDMTPYFNKVLVAAKNSGFKNWYVPLGTYFFNTQPNAIDFEQFRIRGHNRLGSVLYKNFVSNGTSDGILTFKKGYFSVGELGFVGLTGSQANISGTLYGSGCFISAVYQSGDPEYVGYCSVSDCNLTSDVTATDGHGGTGACVYTNIYLDGSAGAVPAVRAMTLNNVIVFGAESASVMFLSTQGIIWNGGETSTAGGKSGRVYIQGTSGVKAAYTQINLAALSDGVTMSYTDGGLIQAGEFNGGVVNFASTCTGTTTMGYLGNGATVSNSGSKCRHISPDGPVTISGSASVAASPGTAITFGVTFAAAPKVTAMVVGANAYAYGSGGSTTGITLISSSGTQLVHWQATGTLA